MKKVMVVVGWESSRSSIERPEIGEKSVNIGSGKWYKKQKKLI